MKKHRVRKMYFVCKNKQIIAPNVGMTNAYQDKKMADEVCKQQQDHYKGTDFAWMKSQPIPLFSVEGFYLIHEDIFKQGLGALFEVVQSNK